MPNARTVYILLCIPGVLLPWSAFLPWFREHGLDVPMFLAELFSTRIGAFFGWDVIVSAAVVLMFAAVEHRKKPIPGIVFVPVSLCIVGVSLALPLLLALRETAALEGVD